MTSSLQQIPEWHDVDETVFRNEILSQYRPAVLKGVVRDWPAVKYATSSPEAICKYLCSLDNGTACNAVLVPPQFRGRMFYQDDLKDFNFVRDKLPLSAVIAQIARYSHFDAPPSVALQCAQIAECIPGFLSEHKFPLLSESVLPRLWIGNEFITPAHFDEMNNIACVVSGTRRFTLFPPEQISNLYIGPLDYTPAGAPVSMVSLENPDFERFPRFREALASAQVAELEPGDAIFIPALWWHHVVSLDVVNILVNYWWEESDDARARKRISPVHALMHSLLSMGHLPPEHRKAWGDIFAYYLFDPAQDSTGHIPEHKQGVLGSLSPEEIDAVKKNIGLE